MTEINNSFLHWWLEDFFNVLASQGRYKDKNISVIGLTAGLGCVHPDTKVYTEQGLIPISHIKRGQKVLSFDEKNNRFRFSVSSGGFLKGKDYLYRVVTKHGEFRGAEHHQSLTFDGIYRPLKLLYAHDCLASCFGILALTKLESVRLSSLSSVQNLKKRGVNCLGDYEVLDHQYDQQPHAVLDSDLVFSPLQGDVLKSYRMIGFFSFLRRGVQAVQKLRRNRFYQSNDRVSTMGYFSLFLGLVGVLVNRILTLPLVRTSFFPREFRQFLLRFFYRHIEGLRELDEGLAVSSCLTLSKASIISITRENVKQEYWDLQVLDDNNYVTEGGLIHHNSGKTHGACQALNFLCEYNRKSQFSFAIMPVYRLIENALIPTMRKVLRASGYVEEHHYKIIKSPYHKIIFANGQEIHMLSSSRSDLLIATEYSHGFISEIGSCKEDVFKLADTRIRDTQARKLLLLVEGVPQGLNFYAKHFDSYVNSGWERFNDRIAYNDDLKYLHIRLTTHDNKKFLPDDYIEKIERIYKGQHAYIESWIYGYFRELVSGNVYSSYNPKIHDIEEVKVSPYKEIDLSFDFNANPMSWVAIQESIFEEYEERIKRDVIIAECDDDIKKLKDACIDFALKFDPEVFGNTKLNIYGDMSGHAQSHKVEGSDYDRIKKYLNDLGFKNIEIHALRSNPVEHKSIGALNDRFDEDQLLILKSLSGIKRSLIGTKYKEGSQKIDKPAGETITHKSDALKYHAWAKYGKQNESSAFTLNI